MNFVNPLAFIGLASILIILIMYLLRQKYTEMEVPSLFLWKQAVELSNAQRPWQKLVRNILMILQMLTAFFIVLALAGPFVKGAREAESYIFVLDASMSMQATDISPTRFESAKEQIRRAVDNARPGSEFSLITAGRTPDLTVNFTGDRRNFIDKLQAVKVTNSGIDLSALRGLLKMQAEERSTRIMIFTDSVMELEGIESETILIGEDTENCGITLVSHVAEPDRTIVLVKVKNYGNRSVENGVALYTDGNLFDIKDVSLSPGEEQDVFFTSAEAGVVNLEARLSEEDALAADNFGYDVVTGEVREPTLLVTGGNVFLDNMLSLLPNTELFRRLPEDSAEYSGYRLYVFDGFLPENIPSDGHIFIFNPPEGNSFIETAGEVPVNSIYKADSGLLKFILDFDFSILKSKSIKPPEWAYTVLSSEDTPLILAGEENGRKVVVAGFDLHNTDLPLKKEFPILMYNFIQWFIPGSIIGNQSISCGDSITLNVLPDADAVRVVCADQSIVELALPVQPFSDTNSAGFYIVEQNITEGGSDKKIYAGFAVNPVKTESDLRRPADGVESAEGLGASSLMTDVSLRSWALLLVLLLILLEWWVFCRGR